MSVHGLLADEVEVNAPVHKLFPWRGNLSGFVPSSPFSFGRSSRFSFSAPEDQPGPVVD